MKDKKPLNVSTVRKIVKELGNEYNTKTISIYASTITNKNIVIKSEKDVDVRTLSLKEYKARGSNVFNKVYDVSKFETLWNCLGLKTTEQPR